MIVKELASLIKEKKCPNCIAFYGEEREMMKNIISLMSTELQANVLKYEDFALDTLLKLYYSRGVFAQKSILVVDNEKLAPDLLKFTQKSNNYIVMLSEKEPKLGKGIESVNFEKLTTPELIAYAQQHLDINKGVSEVLVAVSENDLAILKGNVTKLKHYVQGKVTEEHIEKVCHIPDTFKVFDLIDAICNKQAEKAIYIYHSLNENNVKLITLMYQQFRKVLMVKDLSEKGKSQQEIMDITKLPNFLVKNCTAMARNFSVKALTQIILKLFDMDIKIKTGRCNDGIVYSFILYIL